ncbi:uncharacterized protein LOC131206084 [Anopheles bellator]|uniref:uncharacterized protein LOC131206084 n=1 Tax=Anopheles bellator TaxID=139047 RepID=UPI002647CA97|nr:uncharacterized protein LOC131206084 [Anopheles bellator]
MKLVVLIVATCVVGALCTEKCVPGTTFKEDCNTCRCAHDGRKACTRKVCPPHEQELSDESVARAEPNHNETIAAGDEKDEVHLQTNGQVCTPNEIKMKECNRCRCANNGIGWFCTRRACPPREKRSPSPMECEPGTAFKSDCNDCFCTKDGKAACTLKACQPAQRRRRAVAAAKKQCTPGESFLSEDGCNTCHCNDDRTASCGRMACPSEGDEPILGDFMVSNRRRRVTNTENSCTPGSTFKDSAGCNDCVCMSDGKAACTMKLCQPLGETEGQHARHRRSDNATWKKHEKEGKVDGATGKKEEPEKDVDKVDEGKEVEKEQPVEDAESLKRCQAGESYRHEDGCNMCTCAKNGEFECTKNPCPPRHRRDVAELPRSDVAPGTPGFRCEAGKSFKYRCNNCLCSNDGLHAGCTYKYCLPGEW